MGAGDVQGDVVGKKVLDAGENGGVDLDFESRAARGV